MLPLAGWPRDALVRCRSRGTASVGLRRLWLFFVDEAVSGVVTGWRTGRGLVHFVMWRVVSKEEESAGAARKPAVSQLVLMEMKAFGKSSLSLLKEDEGEVAYVLLSR